MNPSGTLPAGDNLVLIGPMGAGKSSLGRQLAHLTARRWVDTDKMVVQRVGLPIADIFSRHGEDEFRRLESEALDSLRDHRRLVVATGGGIVTRPGNDEILRGLGCVIFLTATPDVLFERVSRNQSRPLLHTPDPARTLRDLLAVRQPLYEACAHFTVDTSDGTHEALARVALARAREFFAGHPAGKISA